MHKLNCRNLKSNKKNWRLSLPRDPRSHRLPYWSLFFKVRGDMVYHFDFYFLFSRSEETKSTILIFSYFKFRGDLVYHFWSFLFIYGGKAFHVTFFFQFTEVKPTTCFSDREGIAFHNDQSGKSTPRLI